MYLDCPPAMGLVCPNEDAKARFVEAIQRGDITYHAFPFNSELEFMESTLTDFGL